MTSTLKTNIGIAVVMMFLVMGAFAIDAKADDEPTTEDIENLEDIKNNQEVIEETREAHERFMQAKAWNEAEVAALGKNGWSVNWETMQLERF